MEEQLEITVKELKQLMDSGGKVQLIDVREQYEYDYCRISGSRLMPIREVRSRVNELNPEDEYVFYCHVGERSWWVVNFLHQLGFKKVRNLRGGIDEWAAQIDRSLPRY